MQVSDQLTENPPLTALFLDELSSCIAAGSVEKATVSSINSKFIDMFQRSYITDIPLGDSSEQVDS